MGYQRKIAALIRDGYSRSRAIELLNPKHMTKQKSIFSRNLVKARKMKGWSQEQAARQIAKACLCEISKHTYQNWELDRAEPDITSLLYITEAFAIDDLYMFLLHPIKTA